VTNCIKKRRRHTLQPVIGGLLVLAGGVVSALAFPRIGPGWLILPGVTLFLAGLRIAGSRAQGLAYGALYGLTFFAGVIWWLSELGLIAVIPLVIVQAAYFVVYGWWLAGYNQRPAATMRCPLMTRPAATRCVDW